MFDKMKELMEMQKKMQELKKELDNTLFDISSSDGLVKLTMSGAQEVKQVVINSTCQDKDKARLENAVKDAYNRAIKHSQEVAAQKMKGMTGFNLPGL